MSLFGQRKSDVFIMFHDSCSPWVHLSAEDVGVKWCQQTSERKEGVQHADSCYQWLDSAVMQGRHQSSLGGIPNTRRTHTDREREREAHPHMTNRNRKTWTHWTLNFLLSWVQVWQLIGWESHLLFSNASTTNGLTHTHTHPGCGSHWISLLISHTNGCFIAIIQTAELPSFEHCSTTSLLNTFHIKKNKNPPDLLCLF